MKLESYITIDIGGTAIKYGVLSETGQFLFHEERASQAELGGIHIMETVKKIVEECLLKYTASGICISTAGMVDVERGRIVHSGPQIPGYGGTEIKSIMEKSFGLSCEVENDVNCAGLAESISGAGKGKKSVLCLTVGTGIGGCFVENGKVYHGHTFSACEVGYMKVHGAEFQDLGSATALVRNVAFLKGEKKDTWNGKKIFEEARKGDEICIHAIEELCDVLAEGISNLTYILNPEVVILGGGIMVRRDYLHPLLDKKIKANLVPYLRDRFSLEMAQHGNHAGMLGAYYHFLNCRHSII